MLGSSLNLVHGIIRVFDMVVPFNVILRRGGIERRLRA